MAAYDKRERRAGYLLVLIFLVLTAGIALGGFFYYQSYERNFRIQVEHQLSAIADLKVNELVNWRWERLADANVLLDNPAFSALVRRFFENQEDVKHRQELHAWLQNIQAGYLYDRVYLLDVHGAIQISVPDAPLQTILHLEQDTSETLKSGQVKILDLHRDAPGAPPHMTLLIPIYDDQDKTRPLGVLALRVDPQLYLYPMIKRWPTPSETAETLIVRRDGNDALFLNELRFQKNSELSLRIPLSQTNTPAVAAVLGHEGIMEGVDYRDVPVVAVTRSIPDSPWFMVARMDRAEVYAPIRQRLWLVMVLGSVLLFGAMAGMGMVWRQQRSRFYQERYEVSEALRRTETRLQAVLDYSPALISIKDLKGNILLANRNFAVLDAPPLHALIGQNIFDIFPKDVAQALWENDQAAVQTDGPIKAEETVRHEDGTWHTYLTVKFPVRETDDTIFGTCAISTDITERVHAEEALRETKAYLENLITYANAPIIVWDRHFKISRFNHAFEAITGRRAEEVLGESLAILFPPDQVQDSMELIRKTVTGPRWETVDIAILHVDGSIRSVLWNSATILDADGKMPLATIAQGQDITARKRAEKAMRAIAFHQDALLSAIPDIVMEVDQNKVYTWVNQPGIEFFGEDVIGKRASDYFEGEQDVFEVVQPLFNGDDETIYLESWQRRKDGEKRLLAWWCKALKDSSGNVTGALSSARDITDRIRAEEALRESKDQTERYLNGMLNAFVLFESVFDDEGRFVSYRFVHINEAYERITGVKNDEVRGKTIHEVWPETEAEWIQRYGEVAVTGVSQTFDMYHQPTSKHYHCNVYRPGHTQGRFCVVFEDITDRMQAAEALRASEIRYRRLFESAKDGILILDADTGAVVDINPFLIELLGFSREDTLGKKIWDMGFLKDVIANEENFLELQQKEYIRYENLALETASGQRIEVEFISNVYLVNQKKVIQCNIRDITERKRAEDRLRSVLADLERSNKELEQFAYVASHDLQEPLRMVASYTQLLANHYEGQMDEKAKKYIDYAVDGAVRMQNLINDLLAYSRVGTRGASLTLVDSHAALGLALVNLQGAIQESGAIVTNDNLPKVYGDETQLAQLFQNLIGNAIKFHGAETPHVHITAKIQGHIAEFCVHDNGIGIDPKYADRIFQLFQRLHTRAEYPGTGIGLALCKRIVDRHGGKIWFDSEPGKGAYFHFTVSTSK